MQFQETQSKLSFITKQITTSLTQLLPTSCLLWHIHLIPTLRLLPTGPSSWEATSTQPSWRAWRGMELPDSHIRSALRAYRGAGVAWVIREVVTNPVALPAWKIQPEQITFRMMLSLFGSCGLFTGTEYSVLIPMAMVYQHNSKPILKFEIWNIDITSVSLKIRPRFIWWCFMVWFGKVRYGMVGFECSLGAK